MVHARVGGACASAPLTYPVSLWAAPLGTDPQWPATHTTTLWRLGSRQHTHKILRSPVCQTHQQVSTSLPTDKEMCGRRAPCLPLSAHSFTHVHIYVGRETVLAHECMLPFVCHTVTVNTGAAQSHAYAHTHTNTHTHTHTHKWPSSRGADHRNLAAY
jgi:hypothetical protein